MAIESARYNADGSIIAVIAGLELTVPDDAGNRHRQELAEWAAAGNTIAAYVPPGPTEADIIAERQRRLAAGFLYDFGDARGTHEFGTTDADMAGWTEVTQLANALLASGDTATAINIVTNTGHATVTAAEWQYVLLAAASFRQPIWAASFALQAMEPIPADFDDDQYWP